MTLKEQHIQSRLDRKFTRGIVRMMLSELTDSFLNKQFDELAQVSVWFMTFNIPVKFNEKNMKYQICDHSFVKRFIPEEHESMFDELNELQHSIYPETIETRSLTDEKRLKMIKIFTYLETEGGYTLSLVGRRYVLKNISE